MVTVTPSEPESSALRSRSLPAEGPWVEGSGRLKLHSNRNPKRLSPRGGSQEADREDQKVPWQAAWVAHTMGSEDIDPTSMGFRVTFDWVRGRRIRAILSKPPFLLQTVLSSQESVCSVSSPNKGRAPRKEGLRGVESLGTRPCSCLPSCRASAPEQTP